MGDCFLSFCIFWGFEKTNTFHTRICFPTFASKWHLFYVWNRFVSYALHRRCDLSKKFRSSRLLPPFQFWPTSGFWSSCLGQHAAGRAESCGWLLLGFETGVSPGFLNHKKRIPPKNHRSSIAPNSRITMFFWGLQFHEYNGNTPKVSDRQRKDLGFNVEDHEDLEDEGFLNNVGGHLEF